MSARVAFLGLGIMGSRMAANLVGAGFDVTVWNRTTAKAEEFSSAHGAPYAATPGEAAAEAEFVITMVVDAAQVETVLLGEGGVAGRAAPGTVLIDSSTIGPAATRRLGAELGARELTLIDAPVTGSSPRAADGTLTFMVGASDQNFARIQPLLSAMGEVIVHAGPQGHGQTVKVINNAVAAANASVLGQALLVATKAGVDLDALATVMASGSGGSTMLNLKAGPMREHDYSTLFKLEHMLKDVRLCLEEGQALGVPFPAAAEVGEVLTAGVGRGLAEADFAALIEVLEGLAGTRL